MGLFGKKKPGPTKKEEIEAYRINFIKDVQKIDYKAFHTEKQAQ